MCVLGMGKLRLPPSSSLRDCPSIPSLANGNLVPQEQDLMRTSPLRNLLPRQPAPAGCSGMEGCDKDLPRSFQMWLLPWGTPGTGSALARVLWLPPSWLWHGQHHTHVCTNACR